jgi:aminopeptidase N
MRNPPPQAVRLADYRPPDFLVDSVDLDISLHRTQTRVVARLSIRRNPQGQPGASLSLDGDGLVLRRLELNGRAVADAEVEISPDRLILRQPPDAPFRLEIETELDPSANTQLTGLYRSGSAYCTQCEAEGFRRITYFLDRPDVLSVYTTRIEAARSEAPVLLGNGNPVAAGDLDGGRHFAVWRDPFPKPSYLFALVGGDLGRISERYTTRSGRTVDLAIYVEHGNEPRAAYAMDSLIRAMRWDEEAFGREYDLDVFNIVAVSDFNMGAMENKGLNIFNDKYVLASPETATDSDYAGIEAVIAHEYFHNWTGNRITCRDWFQLCLKEGLTVFRDQEFSADQRSRAVKRISDVRGLRLQQFPEDAGPLAHPVRPRVYHEINNFYTATVYEKGAEIVRMLKTLIGDDAFRKGMDIYFERFDGTAATVEDFLSCFAESSGRDLSQFALWYEQAGTPLVSVDGVYDRDAETYTLTLEQSTPPTPGQSEKKPVVIPIALGLIGENGDELPLVTDADETGASEEERARGLIELSTQKRVIMFRDVPSRPVVSLLRNFSAPVRLAPAPAPEDLQRLLAHDRDPFNRWQAAQSLALRSIFGRRGVLRSAAAHRRDERVRSELCGASVGASVRNRHCARNRPRRRPGRHLRRAFEPAPRARRRAAERVARRSRPPRRRRALLAGRRQRRAQGAAQRRARSARRRRQCRGRGPGRAAVLRIRQYDRQAGRARDLVVHCGRGARSRLRRILCALRERSSRDRQMVCPAGDHSRGRDDRARRAADGASGVLSRQSESRSGGGRRLRQQ